MVGLIPTATFLWPTWHPGWKDTRATPTPGATDLSCPHPLSQEYTGHIQRILPLKKVVVFGLEVRCRNY